MIAKLTDHQLLSNIKTLLSKERELLVQVLNHLQEIQRRRLFCDLGYKSLFDYCVNELDYSKEQAYRRINAMKVARKNPEIKKSIEEGKTSLSNINRCSTLFNRGNIIDSKEQLKIIKSVEGMTKDECEDKILSMEKERGIAQAPAKSIVKKVSTTEVRMHLNLKKETLEKLEKIKELYKEEDLDKLISKMCDKTIEEKIATKKEQHSTAKNSRFIPKLVKEKVYKKANGQCQNCASTKNLEFDHIVSFACGGDNRETNIQLLCKSCNQRKGIKEFGQNKMDRYLNKEVFFQEENPILPFLF